MKNKDDNEQVPYYPTMSADCSDDIRDSFRDYDLNDFHRRLDGGEYSETQPKLIELNKD